MPKQFNFKVYKNEKFKKGFDTFSEAFQYVMGFRQPTYSTYFIDDNTGLFGVTAFTRDSNEIFVEDKYYSKTHKGIKIV